jgi:hypothetical protein
LADFFCVDGKIIFEILNGDLWKHVDVDFEINTERSRFR